jgi:hypothetical protein
VAANAKAIVFPNGADSARLLCVVAVAGQLTATGQQAATPARWGVFIFDAATGDPIASQIGTSGDWPDYFDTLPQR